MFVLLPSQRQREEKGKGNRERKRGKNEEKKREEKSCVEVNESECKKETANGRKER